MRVSKDTKGVVQSSEVFEMRITISSPRWDEYEFINYFALCILSSSVFMNMSSTKLSFYKLPGFCLHNYKSLDCRINRFRIEIYERRCFLSSSSIDYGIN